MVMLTSPSGHRWKPSEFGPIPSEWEVFEVFDFEPFITSGSRGWAKYYSDTGSPFIRITNLSHDDIDPDLSDLRFVAVSQADAEAKRTQLEEGDVLISITADIGAIGYVGSDFPLPSYINQHIACVRLPQHAIDSKYVAFFLTSNAAQRRFAVLLDVGAKTGLNLTTIGRLKILCPPPSEQHEIAAALSDADAWIKSLENVIAKKRAIKRGVVQELLSARRRLPGFTEHWTEKSFKEVFDFYPTATNSRADLGDNGDVFYIHYGDIHTRFHSHLDFRKHQPSRIDRNKCRNAAFVRNGDWIMVDASEDYDGVGKSIEILGLPEDARAVSGLHTFLLRERAPTFVPGFKGHLGNLNPLHAQYIRVMTGMKVFGVSKSALRDLILLVPPPNEQAALVEVLSDMDDEITIAQQELTKARLIKQGMMQELLTGRVRLV